MLKNSICQKHGDDAIERYIQHRIKIRDVRTKLSPRREEIK